LLYDMATVVIIFPFAFDLLKTWRGLYLLLFFGLCFYIWIINKVEYISSVFFISRLKKLCMGRLFS
jgi:hypothetical protein